MRVPERRTGTDQEDKTRLVFDMLWECGDVLVVFWGCWRRSERFGWLGLLALAEDVRVAPEEGDEGRLDGKSLVGYILSHFSLL